jgi:aryl carrier-like protein
LFLQERLPAYMTPSRFVFMEELPTTSSGKLNRAALPDPEGVRPELESLYATPQTRTERELVTIWSRALDLDRIGIDDNFFALGGDSIRAIQVVAAAEAVGMRLTVQDLFHHQTVRQLAARIPETMSEEAPLPPVLPFSLITRQDFERLPDGIVDAYPLARMQAGLLFHSDQFARSSVYRATFLYRLRGRLDPERFRTAVEQTIERHAILRTSFDLVHFSEPLQILRLSISRHCRRRRRNKSWNAGSKRRKRATSICGARRCSASPCMTWGREYSRWGSPATMRSSTVGALRCC